MWLGPDAARDRRLLDAWCSLVGPPSVGLSRPAGEPGRARGRFAIASWNNEVGEGDLSRFLARLRSGELTDGTPVREFAVLLQEVRRAGTAVPALIPPGIYVPKRLGPSNAVSIDTLAAEQKLNLFYAPAMRNGTGQEDRGNAILSTLPMADLAVLELPFERQRRIAVLASIIRDGVPFLRVASVHLETRAGATRGGPAAARQRQAQAVIDGLNAIALPVVIGGDLNTSWGDDEPAVRDMRRRFPDAERTPGSTWAGPLGMSAKLDHFFARTGGVRLEVSKVRDRFGSDHYPLLTVVDF